MFTTSKMQRVFSRRVIWCVIINALLMFLAGTVIAYNIALISTLPRYENIFRFMVEKYESSNGSTDYSFAFKPVAMKLSLLTNKAPDYCMAVYDGNGKMLLSKYDGAFHSEDVGYTGIVYENSKKLTRGEMEIDYSIIKSLRRGYVSIAMRSDAEQPDRSYIVVFGTHRMLATAIHLVVLFTLFGTIILLAVLLFINGVVVKMLARISAMSSFLIRAVLKKNGERLTDNSDDELSIVAENINLLLDEIDNRIEQVASFTGNAAHQLKNPIFGIRVNAECITGICKDIEGAKKHGRMILEESERMQKTVERLMLLAKLDSDDNIALKTGVVYSLSAAVREELELLRLRYAERALRIRMAVDDSVMVDVERDLMLQIVHNLIDNAMKYAPEKSEILIEVANMNQNAVFVVANEGVISEADRQHVFDRFYRGKSRNKLPRGTGLGLAIVKQIIECLSGKIDLSVNEVDGTVRFSVEIPCK